MSSGDTAVPLERFIHERALSVNSSTAGGYASLITITRGHMKRPQWQLEGEDPDYRFSLANERTFLAWIRTALGLLAGGLLIDQLGSQYPRSLVLALALTLFLAGAVFGALAYYRWRANEIAMRRNLALPHNVAIFTAGVATALVASLSCLLILH